MITTIAITWWRWWWRKTLFLSDKFIIFISTRESEPGEVLRKQLLTNMDFNSWNIFWSSSFGLLAVLIILGNFFTIWVFHRQRSRKRSYFLLISLAVADLMVGLFAIPLFIKKKQHGIFPFLVARVNVFWSFHWFNVHLYTSSHFLGENVCHRMPFTPQNSDIS